MNLQNEAFWIFFSDTGLNHLLPDLFYLVFFAEWRRRFVTGRCCCRHRRSHHNTANFAGKSLVWFSWWCCTTSVSCYGDRVSSVIVVCDAMCQHLTYKSSERCSGYWHCWWGIDECSFHFGIFMLHCSWICIFLFFPHLHLCMTKKWSVIKNNRAHLCAVFMENMCLSCGHCGRKLKYFCSFHRVQHLRIVSLLSSVHWCCWLHQMFILLQQSKKNSLVDSLGTWPNSVVSVVKLAKCVCLFVYAVLWTLDVRYWWFANVADILG